MLNTLTMILRTLLFYTLSIVIISLMAIPIIISALLPEQWRYNKVCFLCVHIIYTCMVWATFLPIKISGKEHLFTGPAIYAANHQSALDIPIVGSLLKGQPHIWFLKHELTKLPFIGWIARRLGVSVDRTGPRRAAQSLSQGFQLLEHKNRSLIIFPEGGRFTDGKVHDFLWGFAIIAKKIQRPVIPLLISNAYKAYPPGSFFIHYAPIKVIIGKPFMIEPDESDEQFVNRVHTWFVTTME